MKLLLIACVLAGSAIAWGSSLGGGQVTAVDWVEAVRFEVAKGHTQPNPAVGAMGTSAVAFTIGKRSAGALIDRLERKGCAIFVGMSVPPEAQTAALNDVRAEFLVGDGETARWIAASPGAHAGAEAALYQPPAETPAADIHEFRLLYNSQAAWTR
jgi:hypothetical protein